MPPKTVKPDSEFNQAAAEALKQKLSNDGVTDPAHQAIITDEHAGKGGSYTYDPVTNTRTPIDD